jgi:hypothetical protein
MNVIFDDMNTLSVEKKTHIKKKKTPTFAMASLIDSICLSNTVLRLFILCKYTWMYPVEMAMHVVRYFTIWNIIACLFFYQIFDTIDYVKANHLGGLIFPKARRKGLSIVATGIASHGSRFIEDYHMGVAGGLERHQPGEWEARAEPESAGDSAAPVRE